MPTYALQELNKICAKQNAGLRCTSGGSYLSLI